MKLTVPLDMSQVRLAGSWATVATTHAPPAAWETYLLVGVFPRGSAHAWCKLHVHVGPKLPGGGASPRRHCLSALEALDGPGERVLLVGTPGAVDESRAPVDADSCSRGHGGWGVVAPGVTWHGFPENELRVEAPAVQARCEV